MKILLISKKITELSQICNYSSMQCYHITKELDKLGIKYEFFTENFTNVKEYSKKIISDYHQHSCTDIIALGNKHFRKLPIEVYRTIKKSINGFICQISDDSLLDNTHCDINFTVRDDDWRYIDDNNKYIRHVLNNHYIGWAANDTLFVPQKTDILTILIDHTTFNTDSPDYSVNILFSIKELYNKMKTQPYCGFTKLSVKMMGNNGIEYIDMDDMKINLYNRKPTPLQTIIDHINDSHIFIVTHRESVGLSVIESATSGAFIIVPYNSISSDRLNTVNHIQFNNKILWEHITIDDLNPLKNRDKSKSQTWSQVVYKMLTIINNENIRKNK